MSWSSASLEELCEINVGRTPARANAEFWGAGQPWVSIADMNQGRTITSTKEQITEKAAGLGRVVSPGTVLLSFKLSIGKVAAAGMPLYTNEAIAALPIKRTDRLLPAFLARALEAQDLTDGSNRAAMGATLNKAKLRRIQIPLPSVDEQRRISAILDQVDALRAKRRQALAHLDDLTRSMFNRVFEGSQFESVALEDAIKWKSGRFLPAKEQKGGAHPVYGGNGINGWHDEYMFSERQLVVGRVGAYCGAVHITEPFAWVTDNALIATLLREDVTIDYLRPALIIANLNQHAGVSGQPSISAGKIGSVRLPVPPLRLQREFAGRVDRLRDQIAIVRRGQTVETELFDSLQGAAFRGEL